VFVSVISLSEKICIFRGKKQAALFNLDVFKEFLFITGMKTVDPNLCYGIIILGKGQKSKTPRNHLFTIACLGLKQIILSLNSRWTFNEGQSGFL
jgi:hypothetical protein